MNTITTDMVVQLLGIKVYAVSGNEHYIPCPVCGRRDRKCSYNPTKGSGYWQCFCASCGAHGGAVDLYMAAKGMDDSEGNYRQAVHEILDGTGASDYVPKEYKPEPVVEVQKVDSRETAKSYGRMLSCLPLKEEHKADLRKRGLTEQDISDFGFRSAPENGYELCRKMAEKGPVKTTGVPGFCKGAYDRNTCAGVQRSGYLCPVYYPVKIASDRPSAEILKNLPEGVRAVNTGKSIYLCAVTGFQKRVDDPGSGSKYIWFSSAGRKGGCGSGAQCTVLKGSTKGIVVVTEGILKATVTYCLLGRRITVVGVPGVKSIKGMTKVLKNGGIIRKGDVVFECFDMDKEQMCPEAVREAYDSRDAEDADMSIDAFTVHLKKKQEGIKKDQKKILSVLDGNCRKVISAHWDTVKGSGVNGKPYIWNGRYKGIDDMLLVKGMPDVFIKWMQVKAEE